MFITSLLLTILPAFSDPSTVPTLVGLNIRQADIALDAPIVEITSVTWSTRPNGEMFISEAYRQTHPLGKIDGCKAAMGEGWVEHCYWNPHFGWQCYWSWDEVPYCIQNFVECDLMHTCRLIEISRDLWDCRCVTP